MADGILPRMVDPAGPPEPPPPGPPEPHPPEPVLSPDSAPPTVEPPVPPQQVYALPTARRVVGSGLALALASTSELRRASIYIGLLVLGAFGPAIVATLLILGRLGDGAGDAFVALLLDDGFGPPVQPALQAAMLIVMLEVLVGLLLFITISIDAQVIAIAILGGHAGERPLRLWEAITRARQTFWRMAGAGSLVGVVSLIAQAVIGAAIDGFSRSADASGIIAALLATLVIAPLAYVSTGIVLGDVGAMEALSRSWRLFQARRSLAVVVVLFTFVTSAIHLFAFSAGVDLVARAAEVLQVSLTEGAVAFVTAVVLILAAVVAYGSLSFTVGAVVAAPQVTGFLGLTFFSGGLDKARGATAKPPPGFRYVSRPMLAAFVSLGGFVALQVPDLDAIAPVGVVQPSAGPTATHRPPATARPGGSAVRPPGGAPSDGTAVGRMLQEAALAAGARFEVSGQPVTVNDALGDAPPPPGMPAGLPGLDLAGAEYAVLPVVPGWLLDAFDCDAPQVACDPRFSTIEAFHSGAIVFVHRVNGGIPFDAPRTYAVLLERSGQPVIDGAGEDPFQGANWVSLFVTGDDPTLSAFRASPEAVVEQVGGARARWRGTEVVTLIPLTDLVWGRPLRWGLVVLAGAVAPSDPRLAGDATRQSPDDPLRTFDRDAEVVIVELE
jgi:hypothetical protein